MPSPGSPRRSQCRTCTASRCSSSHAQPESPAGMTGVRSRPSLAASTAAAVSRPTGSVKNTQKIAASVRRLIQVLVPVTVHPAGAGGGGGAGRMDLATAVRFSDRDARDSPGEQAGQPPVADLGSGMLGDETAVTEPGGVPQVHVVVTADELQQRLRDRRAPASAVPYRNCQYQVPASGPAATVARRIGVKDLTIYTAATDPNHLLRR